MIIGSHVDYKKDTGLYGSVLKALSFGSTTFMFYVGAPQNTKRCEVNKELTLKGWELMKQNNIDINNVIVHAPYIINMANKTNFDFNVNFLNEELKRVKELGITKIVIHPGSHIGQGIEEGIKNIIDVLNKCEDLGIEIMLETMAGKGSEVGRTFEELKEIIDGVKYNDKVKVCLDTCHLNDAGYDIANFDKILDEFDKVIGIDKIGCVHINDSKNTLGSHKDRHENIGIGTIGFDNLLNVIYNKRLEDVPKILETPYVGETDDSKEKNYPPYKFEIEMIRDKKFNEHLLEDIRSFYK